MNPYGKFPLEMQCPHCGGYGGHPVIQTDPKRYYWSDEATPLFERIAGRDLSYRQRTKECTKCESQFISVEMGFVFLRSLITEALRLTSEVDKLRGSLNEMKDCVARLESEQNATHTAIRKASKILNRELPERRRPKKLQAK